MQFGTQVNCLLAKYNLEAFKTLEAELESPVPLEYDPAGYLWVAYTEGQLSQMEANVALQNRLGIPSRMLTPGQIREVAPYLNTQGMLGGSFCQEDGHVNPHSLCFAYAEAARRLGARIYKGTEVTGLSFKGGAVDGVHTTAGEFGADAVVCCAGPWSVRVARWAGVELPITPERHQILVTEPVERIRHPMTLCQDDGAYVKQCPNGTFIMGWDNPLDEHDAEYVVNWHFLHQVTRRIIPRMPVLAGVRVVRQWSGPYDITPDRQAIVGATPIKGLYLDCGWSGHGLQFAPSVGRIVAEMVEGREPFIDVSPFRLSRFQEGDLFFEPCCI